VCAWTSSFGAALLANAAWMCVQRLSARGIATGQVVAYDETTGSGSIDAVGPPTTVYRR
jgi:hypothetical protein